MSLGLSVFLPQTCDMAFLSFLDSGARTIFSLPEVEQTQILQTQEAQQTLSLLTQKAEQTVFEPRGQS